VNDQVIGEIRGWDTLASAILGGVIAVFVLIVDKAERSCPAEWCTSDSRRGLGLSP